MTQQSKTPGAGDVGGSEKIDSLKNCQNNLDALRAQYLADIFDVTPNTALTLAELAFDAGCPR